MSLRQKLMAVMAIPAIVLIVATAVSYQASVRRSDSTDLVTRSYRILHAMEAAIADLSSAESGLRGYLITGDAGMVNPYWRSRDALESNVQRMQRLILDRDAARLAATLTDHMHRRIGTLDRLARRARDGEQLPPRRVEVLTKQGEVTMLNVLGFAESLREREAELLDQRTALLDRAEHTSFVIRMVGLPGGLVAAGVLVALFAGRLLRRIESLSENTRRLEQGLAPLSSPVHRDELGELERTLVRTGTKVIELRGELERLASLDPLTGLANRRGFLDTAEHRMELARRDHATLALLFVDADGLKRVNDTMGHATGDEMLQEIGALLRDTFRASDLPARLGGDEFCVLVTADGMAGVDVARTRLRESVAMANRLPGRTYRLSISMGIAVFDRVNDRTVDDLVARADALMYEEKRRKRASGAIPDPVDAGTATETDGTYGTPVPSGNGVGPLGAVGEGTAPAGR